METDRRTRYKLVYANICMYMLVYSSSSIYSVHTGPGMYQHVPICVMVTTEMYSYIQVWTNVNHKWSCWTCIAMIPVYTMYIISSWPMVHTRANIYWYVPAYANPCPVYQLTSWYTSIIYQGTAEVYQGMSLTCSTTGSIYRDRYIAVLVKKLTSNAIMLRQIWLGSAISPALALSDHLRYHDRRGHDIPHRHLPWPTWISRDSDVAKNHDHRIAIILVLFSLRLQGLQLRLVVRVRGSLAVTASANSVTIIRYYFSHLGTWTIEISGIS